MATGDIYRLFVAFNNQTQGKERFSVEVGQLHLGLVLLDTITSQYTRKSDFIKLQYYPIKDWQQAGLDKPSYIDIRSTQSYDFVEIMRHAEFRGQLTDRDIQDLSEFIQSYQDRLKKL